MEYFKTDKGILYQGHVLDVLKQMPDESVDCVMTSPPYWGLRSYETEEQSWNDGWSGELGAEPTFELYIQHLIEIFDEIKRVLKKTGTCWVNLSDTYGGGSSVPGQKMNTRNKKSVIKRKSSNLPKCLLQIPSRFSIQMTDRGWLLRNTLIWHKHNCMPSSVKDRFTVDFEYLFFFTKQKEYYFEQQFEPYAKASDVRYRQRLRKDKQYNLKTPYKNNTPYHSVQKKSDDKDGLCVGRYEKRGKNHRAVWDINTTSFKDAHVSVYPEALCRIPINAGCPAETGIVLDPFLGSGTTAIAAEKLNRKWIGIELNKDYCEIAKKRIEKETKQLKLKI